MSTETVDIAHAIGPRTRRQALWLRYYLDVDAAAYNATKAAKMAGYSERSAHAMGCKLKKKPHLAAAISLHLMCFSIPHRLRFDPSTDVRKMLAEELAKWLNRG